MSKLSYGRVLLKRLARSSWPMSEQQIAAKLGPLFVVSRRFGLAQADKIRPIDDLSESLVNSGMVQCTSLISQVLMAFL